MDKKKALQFAEEKHRGQKRRNGEEYIVHPIRVANAVESKGDEYYITGLFHDLLEDTDATEKEILEYSNEHVLGAVKLLTRRKGDAQYIKNILGNRIAKAVKEQDRIDNLRDCMELIDADPNFVERYLKNTQENFVGKFSKGLDKTYLEVQIEFDKGKYTYTVYGSLDPKDSPLYRTDANGNAWVFQKKWEKCDGFFWAEMGDDAIQISEETAQKIVLNKSL